MIHAYIPDFILSISMYAINYILVALLSSTRTFTEKGQQLSLLFMRSIASICLLPSPNEYEGFVNSIRISVKYEAILNNVHII